MTTFLGAAFGLVSGFAILGIVLYFTRTRPKTRTVYFAVCCMLTVYNLITDFWNTMLILVISIVVFVIIGFMWPRYKRYRQKRADSKLDIVQGYIIEE